MTTAMSLRPQVAALLLECGPMTVEDLARECGVSTVTIRRTLTALITAGQADRQMRHRQDAPGSLPALYSLRTPRRVDDITLGELVEYGVMGEAEAIMFALELEGGE